MASRSIICRSRRLRQIIDLRDIDKSRYFAITEFNNCFIIRSPSSFFLMNILGKRSDLPFSRKSDRKKEKSTVSFTHVQNIICSQTKSQTVGWHCAWADHYLYAVICRSRDGLSANEKKEKFASNGSQQYSTENTVEPLFNGHLGDWRKWPFWRGDS